VDLVVEFEEDNDVLGILGGFCFSFFWVSLVEAKRFRVYVFGQGFISVHLVLSTPYHLKVLCVWGRTYLVKAKRFRAYVFG
jgi:hypothetical protein